ncbi:4-(cytidine 5'-diphospho)-2-C-methyl-D-erythritol kinase [Kordiimonas sp. SCSIO 12610]|uniref:4-(cytidine 5'-diphospho)-2-C-methyl-D-erythritol kinase n=1 Tax=Kordiimonas sp. SCSIO 12610 TaxID=2829597 RepID=UPI00210D022A|nr:4-(cytidine 5'-diphospho)-2-C-methyl-D-erythritol kinase [Kordiimonas sp. SCSIO 12610]UTW56486.1 4-(cytidine 5'-diphospho)-2-C-methyl-D-erythritol kinase [Kordiimonas sp. SCSIO 12610]
MADVGSLQIMAPAKINLFLHVVGKRSDGYHLLQSIFAFTENGDKLTLSPSNTFEFKVEGPFAGELDGQGDATNLVEEAARVFASASDQELDVSITLEKNLPIASGIGGGSADAAATLRLLNRYWGLDWELAKLEEIAIKLGADVPACLYGKPILVQGIGEDISLDIVYEGPEYITLVNPLVSVSTPQVFKTFAATSEFAETCEADELKSVTTSLLHETHNGLEESAKAICPEINLVLDCLGAQEGAKIVRMAGSGATCFALFESRAASLKAIRAIKSEYPNWWVMADKLQN